MIVHTNIAGVPVTLRSADSSVLNRAGGPRIFVGEFYTNTPVMDRPYGYRGTYESDLPTVLNAMAWTVVEETGNSDLADHWDY